MSVLFDIKYVRCFLYNGLFYALTIMHAPFTYAYNQNDYYEEYIASGLWHQWAPEFNALSYQAFNGAVDRLPELLEGVKKPAIIVDLDDTIFNGTQYFTSLLDSSEKHCIERSKRWWSRNPEKTQLISGAKDFLVKAHKLGAEIFYISGRYDEAKVKQSSTAALKYHRLPLKSENHLLFQPALNHTISKQKRRDNITNQGYSLVMLLGDQLDDFSEIQGLSADRRAFVSSKKQFFGREWIALPNSLYGHWEHVLCEKHKEKKPEEKFTIRTTALWGKPKTVVSLPPTERHLIQLALWQYTSDMFQAMRYQTYHQATDYLKLSQKNSDQDSAIIIDIEGGLLATKQPPATLSEPDHLLTDHGIESTNYIVIPEATHFLRTAKAQNIDVYFRAIPDQDWEEKDTQQYKKQLCNLLQKDYQITTDQDHILMITPGHEKESIERLKADKQGNKSRKFVYIISDSLEGFGLKDTITTETVDDIKEKFGREYILLPNPMNLKWLHRLYQQFPTYPQEKSETQRVNFQKSLLKSEPSSQW